MISNLGVSRKVLRALLLRTGQTTQYGGYPDDGYYQKGIAKRYEVLTLGQYSGVTNIVLNGKTDVHSNNCVLDLNTGLMWSRYVAASVGPTSDGKIPWTTNVNGEGIFPFCTAANLANLAGYSDWRVANILELFGLIICEPHPDFGPDYVSFPTFPTGQTICSSTSRTATTCTVITTTAIGISGVLKTSNLYFMLVRGGL